MLRPKCLKITPLDKDFELADLRAIATGCLLCLLDLVDKVFSSEEVAEQKLLKVLRSSESESQLQQNCFLKINLGGAFV